MRPWVHGAGSDLGARPGVVLAGLRWDRAGAAVLRQRYGGQPVGVLGHSLGGITAYQLAARHPELVRVLLVEDVGPVMRRPEVEHPVLNVRGWPSAARTREALADAIRARGVPDPGYFLHSAIGDDRRGWRLLFDYDEMMAVQEHGVGDWCSDWLGSRCPALVLRGGRSTLLPAALAADMVRCRPNTWLVEFADAGHWIHDDDPDGCARAILDFLADHPE